MAIAVAGPASPVQVTAYAVVTVGWTTAWPEPPAAVKPPPVQEEALVELHVRVEACPGVIFVGFAESEAVVTGGGVVKEPAVHGVKLGASPQHVLKTSPFTGSEGFEVCPQAPDI